VRPGPNPAQKKGKDPPNRAHSRRSGDRERERGRKRGEGRGVFKEGEDGSWSGQRVELARGKKQIGEGRESTQCGKRRKRQAENRGEVANRRHRFPRIHTEA